MKILKKFNSKFHTVLKKYIERYTRAAVTTEMIKVSFLNNNIYLISEEQNQEKLLVSLTSYGKRIHNIYLTLESIAQQTRRPDKLVLWISEKEFSQANLPTSLKKMQKKGLEVEFCRDVGPYTKIIYALEKYPDYNIISIDDDIIYPTDMIDQLFSTHLTYPNAVCCNVAMEIAFDEKHNLIPYNSWKHVITECEPSEKVLPLGVNGVLYPPGSFDKDVFDKSKFLELCPKADDLWFKLMAQKNGTMATVTGAYPVFLNSFVYFDSSFIDALAYSNVLKNENDKQMKSIMDAYNIKMEY